MVQWPAKWRRRSVAITPAEAAPAATADYQRRSEELSVPDSQSALLLHAIRTPYEIKSGHTIPSIQHDHELLIRVNSVGLNPIDWKAPDFNFGIPELPYISGRELVGTIVKAPTAPNSRLRNGDVVVVPSTDYRDLRKAAFQEYTIASSFNSIRLPHSISPEQGSILGVAFVSAILALGINMGVDFSAIEDGPDLLTIVRSIDPSRLPDDIRKECLEGIAPEERAKKGDFLVVWGGSSTCAHTLKQLARLVGLRIVSVVDTAKHGLRLSSTEPVRPDLLVDAHDPERAIAVIRSATKNAARFGFDTQGKDSAAHLLRALASKTALPDDASTFDVAKTVRLPTPPSTPHETSATPRSHLVGLTGVPKTNIPEDVALHNVPIKLFHEIPEVGEALSAWCERLLLKGLLVPPDVVGTVEGLEGINEGLDRLRRREVSGGRLVAVLR
ncbi:GroES-like protein [Karstenula rhodostoma CBS 690.94]|uniref:GroES-like protein n=1 Tax=Karstenula rhodostoma CBS 690.94 TaxID=1392251 RepID=A0A9P4PQG1_9PLEO|nr:GroES-like protein [Karstenula rhodostoma CBS 690.94]